MIEKILPAWEWIRHYERGNLQPDLFAGLTVAVMLVPQGMAYAMLAELPPAVGLYASVVPVLVYALFGSSRHLAVGPVAMVSLMVASRCSGLATPGSEQYIAIVLLLTLMVGAVQFVLGVLRAGFLVNFLSRAVIDGFTSAAALIICFSQLKHLLGIPLKQDDLVFATAWEAFRRVGELSPPTLLVGLLSILVLGMLKWKWPGFPGSMTMVLVATIAVWLLGLDAHGVAVVGSVPQGLPDLSFPVADAETFASLVPIALAIAFVGYLESIAIAQSIAAHEKYRVDSDRELRALGLANMAGAFFSGYPVAGGFSRTAVNYTAGAKTLLASLITSGVIVLTLLLLTPLFYYLPKAVLAAVVVVAVAGLINVPEGVRLFQLKWADGVCFLVTFIATLTVGVERGVLAGVVLSLLLFIWRSAHPHMAELGYVAKEGLFRDGSRYGDAKTFPQVLMVRVDASLYFANAQFVESRLRQWLAERNEVEWVLLDMSGVNDIDAAAIATFEELMGDFRARGVRFAFARTKGPVRDLIARAGWTSEPARCVQYASLEQALQEITGTEKIPGRIFAANEEG
ncbi:MAG: SulP family inorganic anion transporter [Planctomycetota bacterium]